MTIMDNSPIGAPAIGRIVVESYEVEQLADCHLYLLPSKTEAFADKARKVLQMLMEKMGTTPLLNDYKLGLLGENMRLDNQPVLMQAIKEEKSNIIMPLSTPSKSDKQYLIVHTDEKDLLTHIPLIVYTSERVSKFSIAEQMKVFAQEEPEGMQDFIRGTFNNDTFLKRWLTVSAFNIINPTFGMAAMLPPSFHKKIGIHGRITHQDKLKMMEQVEENFVHARRDKNLDAMISLLIQSMDVEDTKRFVYTLNKHQQKKFFQMLNKKSVDDKAGTTLEVRYTGKIESGNRTKGRYRLYISNGKRQELVEFAYTDAFLVHLLFLIDKVIKDEVDTLDFDEYKELFPKLSWEVYHFSDGETHYKKIIKGFDVDGKYKRGNINNCIGEIKKAISTTCNKLGVSPSPYYIENINEHLYVSKNKIILPDELMAVIHKWKESR
ncbi:MAG: hypothetical protein IJ606_04740 [Bacteroidaceae bacterium]|nr:hypothetical protein [Bacteroidaceae bacterium]